MGIVCSLNRAVAPPVRVRGRGLALHDMHEETVDGHKGIAARSQATIADGEALMGKLAQDAARANEIAEKLRRGEDAPGKISRPMTGKEFLSAIGWTAADLRHAKVVQELHRLGATEEAIQAAIDDKHQRATYRKVLRRHQRDHG